MKATVNRIAHAALALSLGALGAGCTAGDEAPTAVATLESKSGSTVTGKASFTTAGNMVNLKLTIEGAAPGQHAVHLHVTGDCADAAAMNAQGHWDVGGHQHGLPTAAADAHHTGDCGNMEVGADGTGTLSITNAWQLGTGTEMDILGHAIIFHAALDDGMTQMPPGNAGARQACGVIQ